MKRISLILGGISVVSAFWFFAGNVFAKDMALNQMTLQNPPKWLTVSRVKRVVQRAESFLEWDIRKIRVVWYSTSEEFKNAHRLKFEATAFTRKDQNTIYFGPLVTDSNFDEVLSHELTHIIVGQKYRSAIPKWLEEGLANYVARRNKIDWDLLKSQEPVDITTLVHPDDGRVAPAYHYAASTAAVQMIAARCRLQDLLQLSVGKKLENYLSTFCRIPDMNTEFKSFIRRKTNH